MEKETKINSYAVRFSSGPSSDYVTIADAFPSLDSCCEFAIALHRSSNIPHVVQVFDNGNQMVQVNFSTIDYGKKTAQVD